MSKGTPYKERTNLRTLIVTILIAIIGIILLLLANFLDNYPIWQSLLRDIGSLLFASVAVALLWELFSRRALFLEILSATRLVDDIETTGLIRISEKWHGQVDWSSMLSKTNSIIIFFLYGRTWRKTNWEALCKFAKRSDTNATIILPDPNDDRLIEEISNRISTSSKEVSPEEVAKRISESISDFISIFNTNDTADKKLSIWSVPITPVYSYYSFDTMSIIAFYKHNRGIQEVPMIIVEKGGSLFEYFQRDTLSFIEGPNPLGKKIFP